jgi:hypothetical protein
VAVLVYRLIGGFPREGLYGLTSQMMIDILQPSVFNLNT